jgi:7-cyano-7-deazaguanine synthase
MYSLQAFDIFRCCRSNLLKNRGEQVPGHPQSESMSTNTVPNRNTVIAALLASMAESLGLDGVWLGVCEGSFNADCSQSWLHYTNQAIIEGSRGKIRVSAPFVNQTKRDIVSMGIQLQVPFHLTRSCYDAGEIACGVCGACQARLAAFAANGVEDPIDYRTRELIPKS